MVSATVNVGTLRPDECQHAASKTGGNLLLGRIQLLEMQFKEADLEVIGVQEARSRSATTRAGLHYHMFVGSADENGMDGSEI